MSFYKSEDPTVVAAAEQHFANSKAILEHAKGFKELMGAEAAHFSRDIHGVSFHGLKFHPIKDIRFWSCPDKHVGAQQPRANLKKASKEERDVHAKLLEQWSELVPKGKARTDEFYKTIGGGWGIFWLNSLGWFVRDGIVYLETGASGLTNVTEILGSEYRAAKEK